jgi:hypothetical protein
MTEIESDWLELVDDSVHHVTGEKIQIQFTKQYAYIRTKNDKFVFNRHALVNIILSLNSAMNDKPVEGPVYIVKNGIHTTYLKMPVCPSCTRASLKAVPIAGEEALYLVCPSCKSQQKYETWSPRSGILCESCE